MASRNIDQRKKEKLLLTLSCICIAEWFHGRCVGVKPKSVIETYFCDACVAKSKSRLERKKKYIQNSFA